MSIFDKYTANEVLSLIREAYTAETGDALRVGSEEHAFASAMAYVYGVVHQAINGKSNQRFIQTATGDILDGIGSAFGLSREGLHAQAVFQFTGTSPHACDVGTLHVMAPNGKVFSNTSPVELIVGGRQVILTADDAGSDSNFTMTRLHQSCDNLSDDETVRSYAVTIETSAAGGADTMSDDVFREYILRHVKGGLCYGTAGSYENRAIDATPFVTDAHCTRQDEAGYVDGTAQVALYIPVRYSQVSIFEYFDEASETVLTTRSVDTIVDAVTSSLTDDTFKPLCDRVVVSLASSIRIVVTPKLVYGRKYSVGETISKHFYETFYRYSVELSKTNAVYSESELARRLCTPDPDTGVCAIAFDDGRATPSYYQPSAGSFVLLVCQNAYGTPYWDDETRSVVLPKTTAQMISDGLVEVV